MTAKNPAWKGWTEDVIAAFERMNAEGFSSGQIAKALGCTRNAVVGRRYRSGLKGTAKPSGGAPTMWKPEDTTKFASMYERGITYKELADYFECDQKTVWRQIKKMGLVRERQVSSKPPAPTPSVRRIFNSMQYPERKNPPTGPVRTHPGKTLVALRQYECHAILKDDLYCAAPVKDAGGSARERTYCATCHGWMFVPESKSDRKRSDSAFLFHAKRAA